MESFSDRGEYSFEVQVWPDVLLEQVFPALIWDSIDCQGEKWKVPPSNSLGNLNQKSMLQAQPVSFFQTGLPDSPPLPCEELSWAQHDAAWKAFMWPPC